MTREDAIPPDAHRPPVDTNRDRPATVSAGPGDGALHRDEANRDATTRRWDRATPNATVIGRPENPDDDLGERIRRLHEERHPAMAGHADRMHALDKVRITQALCNALELTPWERDRALGVVAELDLTEFGSQRAIPTVALVAIQHVVDDERRRRLGLHDRDWIAALPPDAMTDLYDRFESITDDRDYRELLEDHDLGVTNVNRLDRTLQEQLERLGEEGAVLGRSPNRDPNLPDLASDRER